MRQLCLPLAAGSASAEVELGPREYRHLVLVLRKGVGDEIAAVDTAGRRCVATVLRIDKGRLTVEVRRAEDAGPASGFARGDESCGATVAAPRLELYQCLPKGRKMDIIVRQAAEAGLAAIVPVRSARSVPEPSASRADRWRRIAVEAAEQSGRRGPLAILPEQELAAAAAAGSDAAGLSVFFHEEPAGAVPLHRLLDRPWKTVRILVGPEGGLAPEERRLLAAAGWRQAWLGPTVLRTETAALAAAGAVSVLMLEKEAWRAE